MRIFVTTPVVKGGSTVLSWLLGQHSYLNHSPLLERIELGAMLNVLDHVPGWINEFGPDKVTAGGEDIVSKIQNFTDSIINPIGHRYSAVKFTNFNSYHWLTHVFPNDKVLVIVRDLSDWYASVKGWNTRLRGTWTTEWIDRQVRFSARSLKGLPSIKIVHLEDLIKHPHHVMRKVHEYLGLPVEDVSLVGQESVFRQFSSDPDSYAPPAEGSLITSPIGRKSNLTTEQWVHVQRIKETPLVQQVLYSEERRLF